MQDAAPQATSVRAPDFAALAVARDRAYIARHGHRSTPRRSCRTLPSPKTEAERQRRLAWEAEMIAEADAEIEAGLFVEEAEVDAWIDSLGTDHELPVPQPRR